MALIDRILRRLPCALVTFALGASGQWWDPGTPINEWVSQASERRLKFSFEQTIRYEERTGMSFGNEPDEGYALVRSRFGLAYKPIPWLKVSALAQDCRAPGYPNAPNTARDSLDLQESYIELFGDRKTGFYMSAGRLMLNYGDTRLIASPQWGNTTRTWDHLRASYRFAKWSAEMLLVSPVKVRIHEFNKPVFGDRIWGFYGSTPDLFRKTLLDVYVLRHDQNRIGGFTQGSQALGTDRLGTNSYGFRMVGPLMNGFKFNTETVLQNGKVAAAQHRAAGFVGVISRHLQAGKHPVELSGEYKYASGTANPSDPSRSGTFDQLYPANHDKFGHADLIGWRNIHNIRAQSVIGVTKPLSVTMMYDTYWLASTRDALYNISGRPISRAPLGNAGRYVGQEADIFATYKHAHWSLGAGYSYFFMGEFIRNTTPGVRPQYLYFFHSYAF